MYVTQLFGGQVEKAMMNDVLETLKLMIESVESHKDKSIALMKAFISNFMMTGIIDPRGYYSMSKFVSVYKDGKLKLDDLRLIIGL